MKLKDEIMALYDGKRSTREIADAVGTSLEYVRVVARQRKGKTLSQIDKRYFETKRYRAGRRAYYRIWYSNGPGLAAIMAAHEAREGADA